MALRPPDTFLRIAVRAWFLVAVAGQWLFLGDLAVFGAGLASSGTLAIHLAFAVVVMVGGPLQLVPQVRRYAPSLHRWNGRVYALAVFGASLAGLGLVWSRERAVLVYLATSLHALAIMTFAVLAVRSAVGRDPRSHRRWALRLFMVVNAGWFFRIGVMQWFFPTTGTFVSLASFADYVLPLAMLELYLRTEERARGKIAIAAVILILTVALAIRIIAATSMGWR